MAEHMSALIVIIPLLSALCITLFMVFKKNFSWHITVLALAGSTYCAIRVLFSVLKNGTQHYYMGNWQPPFGIEYVVDHLNGLVLVMVSGISLLVAIYSKASIQKELSDKTIPYYTLFLLLVTGLLGITITGDVFNLYVLLEISALTSYALIALGQKRAYFSAFNYLILGSIGACFYLLGVGFLLIKSGTLNMLDMASILPHLHLSQSILVGFVFIMIGVLVKMAFFPFHGWLPNAYTHAPTATSCLVAPLMTKVSVYVMIRIMFDVFNTEYVFHVLPFQPLIMWMSVIAIIAGSLFALSQTNIKKMLTYLIVAEIGYMVGGIWMGNANGLTGATYHIIADGFMTTCLFMAIGCIIYKVGNGSIESMKGIFKKMPLTMVGFIVGAFSMIGIPPTCGFFSKWYLLTGAFESGNWAFFVALLFSSLINAVLFFRLIEIGFFRSLSEETPNPHGASESIQEAPAIMTIPLLVVAAFLIGIGLYTNEIVTHVISHVIPTQF